jgi:hypothetical protein
LAAATNVVHAYPEDGDHVSMGMVINVWLDYINFQQHNMEDIKTPT